MKTLTKPALLALSGLALALPAAAHAARDGNGQLLPHLHPHEWAGVIALFGAVTIGIILHARRDQRD